MDSRLDFIVAGAAGILSHNCIFKHEEWHMYATRLLKLLAASFTAIAIIATGMHDSSLGLGIIHSSVVCGIYLLCLFASIVTYRILFHRLTGPCVRQSLQALACCELSRTPRTTSCWRGFIETTEKSSAQVYQVQVLRITHGVSTYADLLRAKRDYYSCARCFLDNMRRIKQFVRQASVL